MVCSGGILLTLASRFIYSLSVQNDIILSNDELNYDYITYSFYLTIGLLVITIFTIIIIFAYMLNFINLKIFEKICGFFGVLIFSFALINIFGFIYGINEIFESIGKRLYFAEGLYESINPQFWTNKDIGPTNFTSGPSTSWHLMIVIVIASAIFMLFLFKKDKLD